MAKKLMINSAVCDARNVSEETLAAYESITINSAMVYVSPESKELLNRYGVTMSCAVVQELDKDVKITSINGSAQITGATVATEKICLRVNGSLTVSPDAGEVLKNYVGITVNGSVTYPESLSAYLGMMEVNGSTVCYPDEAIVLKRTAVIDRTFALRAKQRLYWSAKRMIMVDPQLDPAQLAAKGAAFRADEVIIAEDKVEAMVDRIDERAQLIIVPVGTSVISDDVELDELTLKKYGTKLYILGDVTVNSEEAEVLGKLEYLNIRGDASVEAHLKDQLMEAITEISGRVEVIKPFYGRTMHDVPMVRLSKWLVEQEKEGIRVSGCAVVKLDKDIPNEQILEKLTFRGCAMVVCSADQEAAVAAVAESVAKIGPQPGSGSQEGGEGSVLDGIVGGIKALVDTKMINAAEYVL